MWFSRLSSIFVVVHGVGASLSQVSAKDALKQGSVSRTLASYQKYADELVDAYLHKSGEDPEKPDDQAARDAIQVIYQFFKDLHEYHLDMHNKDLNVGPDCLNEMQNCSTRFWGENTTKLLNNLSAEEEHYRELHKQCRNAQQQGCADSHPDKGGPIHIDDLNKCHAYDEYRRTAVDSVDFHKGLRGAANLPACARKGNGAYALSSPQIESNELTQPGRSSLQEMEECLEEMNKWLDEGYAMGEGRRQYLWPGKPGLYPRANTCRQCDRCCEDAAYCDPYDKVPEEEKFCDFRQRDFEEAHCSYESMRKTHCELFNECRDAEDERCGRECADVALRVAGRKADNETMERIKCLFGVLLDTELPNKEAALTDCKQKDFSEMRATWDIDDCPPGGDGPVPSPVVPGDEHCRAEEEITCDPPFLQREYYSTWSRDLIGHCHYCLAQWI